MCFISFQKTAPDFFGLDTRNYSKLRYFLTKEYSGTYTRCVRRAIGRNFIRRHPMRYFAIIFALIIIASNVIVPSAEADTRYVGDQLVITLRQGKSTKHKILKTLETGTPGEYWRKKTRHI